MLEVTLAGADEPSAIASVGLVRSPSDGADHIQTQSRRTQFTREGFWRVSA